MLDVKVLILFVAAQLDNPVDMQTLYDLCFVDNAMSYFDFCCAVPDLVKTGHLTQSEDDLYSITEKGRTNGRITEDSIALSVRQQALAAVEKYKRDLRRSKLVSTKTYAREGGDYAASLSLSDGKASLMTLEVMAPTAVQARRLEKTLQREAESIYKLLMTSLLESTEQQEE